jgi:predicted metal-binding membrane protein
VAGVMNLVWIALLAALVLTEKLLPAGDLIGRSAGVLLAVAGILTISGVI